MGERVFRLLLALREKAREHFLIQTRDPNMPVFTFAKDGNISEFLRSELETRHRLGYPPFSTLLKFTYEGGKVDGVNAMAEIEKLFSTYHPVTFPSFIARIKGKYHMNALIKIPTKKNNGRGWPDPELLSLIRSLPTEITVQVNPESVI
jgi:primosomal protein N'